MGFAQLSEIRKDATIIENMHKKGMIKKRVFAFTLNKMSDTGPGGELVIGTCPFKSVMWMKITREGYWQFLMDSISFEGINLNPPFCPNGCQTIADTGMTLM